MPNAKVLEKRRERRFEERQTEKQKIINNYNDPYKVTDLNNLVQAFYASRRNVSWKPSLQRYEIDLFYHLNMIISQFYALCSKPLKFHKFHINERGKSRNIQSVDIEARVFQHSLCDFIVSPYFTRSLIYNNSSSIKGRGLDFSLDLMKRDLGKFYRRNGESNKGKMIMIDLHDYFNSIPHADLEQLIEPMFPNKYIRTAIYRIIDSFEGDTGLGLGSQLCQLLAIWYLNGIDHYIKEVLSIKFYGRYMDDSYLIVPNDRDSQELFDTVEDLYWGIGITLNRKKSKIIDLSSESFEFLQKKFRLTGSGRVIVKENKKSGKRLLHKLKKFRELVDDNSITLTYVEQVLESCLGTQSRYSAHRYIIRLREACAKAFPEIYGGNFERLLDIRKIAEEEFDVDKFINENYLPTEEEVKERLYSLI